MQKVTNFECQNSNMRQTSSPKCLGEKQFESTATSECTLKFLALTPVANNRKSTFP